MIFVPKKEECATWHETENGVYILYFYDGNDKREFPIQFFWGKTPKLDKNENIYYEMDYDPFYLSVKECMRDEVLNCPLNACSAKPQLRFNKIINKWFCCCPSSAICTKNDDQDEIDSKLIRKENISSDHKYCDNPIEAILKWNESVGKAFADMAASNIKKFEEWKKNDSCN